MGRILGGRWEGYWEEVGRKLVGNWEEVKRIKGEVWRRRGGRRK
jgi:hypothetical protein